MKKPDKINGDVYFYDDEHLYTDKTGQRFTSVTTLIHEYTHEFDSEFWSSYKAMEALLGENDFAILKKSLLATKKFHSSIPYKFNIPTHIYEEKKAEILQSYEDERNKSCERGTRIHSEFENSFYKSDFPDLKRFGLGGKFICKRDYYELDLDKGVYPEYLISKISSDGILRIAGQIDLMVKDGNDIYLYDWKTNKEIKQKSFYHRGKGKYDCMKYPLNNVMDCNFMHYTLQLSLYAYLLQQINPEFNIKSLKLIHIDHNNRESEYEIEYIKDTVEIMLKHYKKQLKIQQELERDATIKF